MSGYIYLRSNSWYDIEKIYKLGQTENIPNRENNYITCEPQKGYFKQVYQILNLSHITVENDIKANFKKINFNNVGGTEFFYKIIEDLIEPYFKENGIKYKKLTQEEIQNLIRIYKQDNDKVIKPFDYQEKVLFKMEKYFFENNIGKIIWSCGLGKTLLSLFFVKRMKLKNICIGVPSKFLQNQFSDDVKKFFKKKANIITINGEIKNINLTKNINFFITTYNSCHQILKLDMIFDLKIGDEAHHITTIKKDKSFSSFHDIKSKKSLYMTATEKFYENKDDKFYSMNDEKYYGKIIDKRSIKWAIDNKYITDYYLVLLKISKKVLNDIMVKLKIVNESDKNLLISSYTALKSFQIDKYSQLKHLLIYSNKIENSKKIIIYIDYLLKEQKFNWNNDIKNIFRKSITSNDSKEQINQKLKDFEESKLGIISCVYILGEGFNLPKLTGVLIAENMESEIRIVQSCLRANRLDKNNPYKHSYIIIPTVDDFDEEKSYSFDKVKSIVRKFSDYDDIIQKITIADIKEKIIEKSDKNNDKICVIDNIEINNITELKLLELKLIKNKCLNSSLRCEEIEYEVLKIDNKKLNLQTDIDYKNSKERRSFYIENPEEYFGKFELWKNWYHFLNVDTDKLINDKEIWYRKCNDLNIKSKEEYLKRCKEDKTLPLMPSEMFKETFRGFELELKRNKLSYMF